VLAAGPVDDLGPVLALTGRALAFREGHEELAVAGWVHLRAGRPAQALQLLQRALKVSPNWRVRDYLLLALAHHSAGNTKGAREFFGYARENITREDAPARGAGLAGIAGLGPLPWLTAVRAGAYPLIIRAGGWPEWLELELLRREAEGRGLAAPGP
jgi:hypothetical protein